MIRSRRKRKRLYEYNFKYFKGVRWSNKQYTFPNLISDYKKPKKKNKWRI